MSPDGAEGPVDGGISADALSPMLDPARTALVVIDVQHDFAASDGAMGLAGCDLSDVEAVIDRIERLIVAARAAGATVAFTRVVTRPETDSEALKRLYARKGHGEAAVAICRAGAPGAAFYRVAPQPGDIEVAKPLFSSFVGSDLDEQLRARGISNLVLAGLTTDCCVDCTARDGLHRGYDGFVVGDACSAYHPALHAAALMSLTQSCAIAVSTAAVEAAWRRYFDRSGISDR